MERFNIKVLPIEHGTEASDWTDIKDDVKHRKRSGSLSIAKTKDWFSGKGFRRRTFSQHKEEHEGKKAILFKDANGMPVVEPLEPSVSNPLAYSTLEINTDIVKFLKCFKCYDLIPSSSKVVVLDTELIVKKAFTAMVENGVRACPLWDSKLQDYVGMLTITDFMRILKDNYRGPNIEMEAFEAEQLNEWKEKWVSAKGLVFIPPEATIFEAAALLLDNKIHRLPVIDSQSGNVLYIISPKPILRFFFYHAPNLPEASYLSEAIINLQIGTYSDIEVASEDTTVFAALEKFLTRRISALPIVDKSGKLVDVYSKFDVINLAAQETYSNLDIPLRDVELGFKDQFVGGVQSCLGTDSLFTVIKRIVKAEVHRLIIVDGDQKVVGIVTVSDIINYYVVRHRTKLSRNANQLNMATKNFKK